MSGSSSTNRSLNRLGSILTNSSNTHTRHRRSMPILFRSSRSAKKQVSADLNKAEFEFCQVLGDGEMLESMQTSNHQFEATTSDDTLTDRQQTTSMYTSSPTTSHRHHIFSQIKHKVAAHLHDHYRRDKSDDEKNNGYVFINGVDNDAFVVAADQQNTRHPELCENSQMDDDIVDINYIQLESTTPVTPHLHPPAQSLAIVPMINHSPREADILATQAGVECGTPNFEENNVHDTQMSTTDSSTSTNSSNNDHYLNDIDRSILNDNEYVLEQKRDLERITILEISLNNDRQDYLQDLPQNENDELDFKRRYNEARQLNSKLKEELKKLEEEKSRIYSKWACELCTYLNEPYSVTGRDVCEMCEGPSPLKRHTLIS